MPRSPRVILLATIACLLLPGCASGVAPRPATDGAPTTRTSAPRPAASPSSSAPTPRTSSPTPSLSPSPASSPTPQPVELPRNDPTTLDLAFAGDSNAFSHGGASTRLGLGDAGRVLAAADLAVVNLETALADDDSGLAKQPKLYTFLTGRAFPEMLLREGVDVVSLANNHAMDFGVEGMERTLAIKQDSKLPMVGVGATADAAFAPWTGRAGGRAVSVFAGNDILESNMDWRARDGQPGVAMVKTEADFARLVADVAARRAAHGDEVIVVVMHWGIDYQVCTTRRQESMAARLAQAGATIIVGSHAHRVQRVDTIGDTLVAYGLGNFNFYSDRVSTRETGVLSVRVPAAGAPTWQWAPGRIVDGRPVLLTGAEKDAATTRLATLPGGC